MSKKYFNHKNLALLVNLLIVVGNFLSFLYDYHLQESAATYKASEDTFHILLMFLHIAIVFCLSLCALGIWLERLWSLIISLVALLLACVIYAWWYFEKFYFLKDWEYIKGTEKYQDALQKIGVFRGGTEWDVVSFVIVVFLILFISVEIWKKTKTSNSVCLR